MTFKVTFYSACVSENYDFVITTNGGSVTHEQIITKDTYDMLISMGADSSEIEDSGGKLSFYTEDGVEYVKIIFQEKFETLEELNLYLSELGNQTEEGSETDISDAFFEMIKVEVDETGENLYITGKVAKQEDISTYTSCDIIFNLPGEIVSFNIGEKIDSRTIKIDMMEIWESSSMMTFSIESEVSSQHDAFSQLPGCSGSVIPSLFGITALFGAFLVAKKRKDE